MGLKARRSPRLRVWKDRAVTALAESVAHWERLRDGTQAPGEGPFAESCACCAAFRGRYGACWACPVSARTGHSDCIGTPYHRARDEFADPVVTTERQAEVDYLRETLAMVQDGRLAPPEGE